jgi:hypothetical protein
MQFVKINKRLHGMKEKRQRNGSLQFSYRPSCLTVAINTVVRHLINLLKVVTRNLADKYISAENIFWDTKSRKKDFQRAAFLYPVQFIVT